MSYKINKYFSYDEFITSTTAKKYGIKNIPNEEEKQNIYKLANDILLPIREAYGRPIVISSGFRCKELNSKVGGAANSDHLFAAACDLHSLEDTALENSKIFNIAVDLANKGKIHCRQIIDEYNYNWIHISVNHSKNKQKDNQILHLK